jgi:hypothetical protein
MIESVTLFDKAVEAAAKSEGLRLGERFEEIHGYARPVFLPEAPLIKLNVVAAEPELQRLMQYLGGNQLVEQLAQRRVTAAALALKAGAPI